MLPMADCLRSLHSTLHSGYPKKWWIVLVSILGMCAWLVLGLAPVIFGLAASILFFVCNVQVWNTSISTASLSVCRPVSKYVSRGCTAPPQGGVGGDVSVGTRTPTPLKPLPTLQTPRPAQWGWTTA